MVRERAAAVRALAERCQCSESLARVALSRCAIQSDIDHIEAAAKILIEGPLVAYSGEAGLTRGESSGDRVFCDPYIQCFRELAHARVREAQLIRGL